MMKRLLTGIITGALLGIVCIIGASTRSSEPLAITFLVAFWYNRVIMGLAIGLMAKDTLKNMLIKGVVIGTLVSFAFYISTDFQDLMGFLAGIVYGAIIAYAIYLVCDAQADKPSKT